MRKGFCFFAVAAFFLFGAAAAATFQAEQGQRQIEEDEEKPQGRAALRVTVDQIKVDVTVQDKNGNLIGGLGKENFRIYEDKVEQEITYFTPVEAPMTAILVTEYSKVIPWEWLYEAWLASHIFIEQMRPEDWVAIVAYDMKPEILVDFTQNKAQAFNALRRLNYPAFRESNLYDTIYDVLDRIEELDSKVAIIVVSSGLDTFSKKNLDETLDKVRKTNAVIYAVSLGGNMRARSDQYFSTNTRMDLFQADAVFKAFAKYTGGMAFFPRFVQAYRGVFQTISMLLRNQYSLGYVSTNTKKDGKLRKLKVEVVADIDGDGKPDQKLKVKHREGYVVDKG